LAEPFKAASLLAALAPGVLPAGATVLSGAGSAGAGAILGGVLAGALATGVAVPRDERLGNKAIKPPQMQIVNRGLNCKNERRQNAGLNSFYHTNGAFSHAKAHSRFVNWARI
jgi:hypothetical protein